MAGGLGAALLLGGAALVAVGGAEGPPAASPSSAPAGAATSAPAAPSAAGGVLAGLCEASAIVRAGDGYLVGDNETEDRLHGFTRTFQPAAPRLLSAPVEDVEALVQLDGGLLVVGSQGANKNGKRKPGRELVLLDGHGPVRPDLSGCEECEAVRTLPPKEGGLSVEGAAGWAGSLWLGVRSPAPGGKALLLRMEGDAATSLRVGGRVELDLGGFGVRDLATHEGALLVLAGPVDGREAPHRLYRLARPDAPVERLAPALPPGAEGIVVDEGALVVVTDGDGEPGEPCKTPARWVRLPLPGG